MSRRCSPSVTMSTPASSWYLMDMSTASSAMRSNSSLVISPACQHRRPWISHGGLDQLPTTETGKKRAHRPIPAFVPGAKPSRTPVGYARHCLLSNILAVRSQCARIPNRRNERGAYPLLTTGGTSVLWLMQRVAGANMSCEQATVQALKESGHRLTPPAADDTVGGPAR